MSTLYDDLWHLNQITPPPAYIVGRGPDIRPELTAAKKAIITANANIRPLIQRVFSGETTFESELGPTGICRAAELRFWNSKGLRYYTDCWRLLQQFNGILFSKVTDATGLKIRLDVVPYRRSLRSLPAQILLVLAGLIGLTVIIPFLFFLFTGYDIRESAEGFWTFVIVTSIGNFFFFGSFMNLYAGEVKRRRGNAKELLAKARFLDQQLAELRTGEEDLSVGGLIQKTTLRDLAKE